MKFLSSAELHYFASVGIWFLPADVGCVWQPYDLLHVAAHGTFATTDEVAGSAIFVGGASSAATDSVSRNIGGMDTVERQLAAELPIGPDSFNQPLVERRLRAAKPIFFNACEVERLAWGMTGASGWAATLVTKGALAFIGPLWLANDGSARTFSHAFYTALINGDTLGEAAQRARQAAKRPGDPTWLSYSVYGHPNARLAG